MSQKNVNWCITLYPHTTETCWEEIVTGYISTNQLKFMAMGDEVCPSTGTLHYQCYASFPNPVRLKTVIKMFPECHAEIMRGSLKQNEDYCSKESQLKKFGTQPIQGARSDLLTVKRKFDEGSSYKDLVTEDDHFQTIAKFPRFFKEYAGIVREKKLRSDRTMPKVYINIGETGQGKTRWLDEQFGYDGWRQCPSNLGQWFDGCDERPVIVFDDVENGQIPPFALWKRLCDRYPLQVPVKGGFILWKPEVIVFTSNSHPKNWWGELDYMNWSAFCRRVYKLSTFFGGQVEEYCYNGSQEEIAFHERSEQEVQEERQEIQEEANSEDQESRSSSPHLQASHQEIGGDQE